MATTLSPQQIRSVDTDANAEAAVQMLDVHKGMASSMFCGTST